MHVVADEPDRTGREDADGLGFEQLVSFPDGSTELFLTAEHDVFFLHVCGKAVRHIVFIVRPVRPRLIAPREPAIEAAPDGSVGDVHYVAGGAQDDSLAARVRAASLGDDAGNGPSVRADFRHFLIWGRFIDNDLLGPFTSHFGRDFSQKFLLNLVRVNGLNPEVTGLIIEYFHSVLRFSRRDGVKKPFYEHDLA